MVSDELPDGQMIDQWEPVGPNSIQTPYEVFLQSCESQGPLWNSFSSGIIKTRSLRRWCLQVYESLQAEGYCVDYERIPITDEKSPKERDFDSLVSALR